ncbi:MAG: quinolinate synthase NadA [Proteobacteria bacterium]|nr:quinolinate synthase NadA [Pseudomonadota bacterium]
MALVSSQTIAKDFSSFQSTYEYMHSRLKSLMPEAEIALKSEMVMAIHKMKKEKNVLILGHNYMEPALYHAVADICGDSLKLARQGASSSHTTIMVCGVRFMAETAKILSPHKTILLPNHKAGCSLAASMTGEDIRHLRQLYPGVPVVSYVNTYADVKAESDICCTSSNAVAVVNALSSDMVIFVPDRYLAANVAQQTGKQLIVAQKEAHSSSVKTTTITGSSSSDNTMITWNGTCEVHEKFEVDDINQIKAQYGDSVAILAHPECSLDVCEAADFSGSTSSMIDFVQNTKASRYLLLTECAMADNIIAQNPQKELLRMCSYRCPHMATITLPMVLHCLETFTENIDLDPTIQKQAFKALKRMTEIG